MSRFGWAVFLITSCCAVGGGFSDRLFATILYEAPNDPRNAVQQILAADMTAEERMTALEQYIDFDKNRAKIEEMLGKPTDIWIHGGGGAEMTYWCPYDAGLRISYDQGGKVIGVYYQKPNEKAVRLP